MCAEYLHSYLPSVNVIKTLVVASSSNLVEFLKTIKLVSKPKDVGVLPEGCFILSTSS